MTRLYAFLHPSEETPEDAVRWPEVLIVAFFVLGLGSMGFLSAWGTHLQVEEQRRGMRDSMAAHLVAGGFTRDQYLQSMVNLQYLNKWEKLNVKASRKH